uniref:STE3p n=1 Tax=Cryptococcus gattii TaxID=552467 RepID=Q5Y248_CRYGA|nr:STE3p [Cryptococcus gattii]
MPHPDYPFWNLIALVLVLLPAPWHWRAHNIATVSLIVWLTFANLCGFINTIIWAGSYADKSPVWCDISSRVPLLVGYAVPLCSLSQMRRLESVASTRRPLISSGVRKQRVWEEIIICLLFPVILTALQYVVQGHRYDIIEGIGCSNPTFMSVPGLIIRFIIPMVVAVTSLIFAALAVRWFLIRRLQFRTILASSDSKLSIGRYIRLIALAVTDSTVVLVVIVYAAVNALSDSSLPMRPYRDWAYVHQDFSQISQYPEELFASSWPAVVMNVYAPILYSILFFTFFGFGEEAVSEYLAIGDKIVQLLEKMGFMCKRRSGSVFKDLRIDLGSTVVPAFDGNNLESTSLGDLRDDTSEKGFQSLESRAEKVTPPNNMGIAVRIERSVVF